MAEADYYKLVEDFVKKEFKCQAVKQQVGTNFGKVDVIGLREDHGNFSSHEEIIAVEVKDEKASFLASLGQALVYSIYAHKCYLAYKKRYNNKFSDEEKDLAATFGVGLIEIKADDCKIVLTSKLFDSKENYVLHILDKMGYFKCSLCRSIYLKEEVTFVNPKWGINFEDETKYLGNLQDAILKRKNARYWLYELGQNREEEDRKYIWDQRFICKDCVSIFASLVK